MFQKILCATVVAAAGVTYCNELRAKTVALWLFDDPPGARGAADSSGHDYDLTLGPGAEIAPHGKYGNALDADGGTANGLGAFRYQIEKELNPDNENWTLECWVNSWRFWGALCTTSSLW